MRSLRSMEQMPSDVCMKVLGTHVQQNGGHEKEFAHMVLSKWATFHSKRPLWSARGIGEDKAKALHLSVFPTIAWCVGRRHWPAQGLRQLHMMQLRVTRRLAKCWPRGSEGYPEYARRTARWACELWSRAHIPVWDEAIVGIWWRWAGNLERLGATDECRLCHVATT